MKTWSRDLNYIPGTTKCILKEGAVNKIQYITRYRVRRKIIAINNTKACFGIIIDQ